MRRWVAEMILGHIYSVGGIRFDASREVEVSAFVADVRKALRLGLLHSVGESLDHLEHMIESKRAELIPLVL